MKIHEIAASNFYESLKLAQRFLFFGALASAVAFFSVIHGDVQEKYILPYVGIEVRSLDFYSSSILVFYLACGVMCHFGVQKATDNLRIIDDEAISAALLNYPNIFLSGDCIKAILYGLFYMVSASLVSDIFRISGWSTYLVGFVFSIPYWLAINESKYFKIDEKAKLPSN